MFGISLAEISIIFLAAIIFIKPNDLPAIFRLFSKIIIHLKKTINKSRQEYNKIASEFNAEYSNEFFENIDEINDEVSEIIGNDGKLYKAYDVTKLKKEIKESFDDKK